MKKNERIWNEEDVLFLKENYKKFGAEYCSEKLNRTISAISKRASIIGVTSKNRRWYFEKEYFTNIIKNSHSLKEVLLKINLRAAGGNYKTIHKYIHELKLNTSHFTTKEEYGRNISNKKPIGFYLIKNNKTSSGTHLKKRLYKEGLLKNICCKCGQGEIWNGEKISLVLDHKNGNHYDWRLENLRIVCPNCNATLDTHCGKNKNRINKCVDCKKNITHKKRCVGCFNKYIKENPVIEKRKVKDRPSKQELIKLIEEHNYSYVGRLFGVSDNTIRKWLK